MLAQLRLTLEGQELKVGEALLDEIDDAGYLAYPLVDVLSHVQSLVPAPPMQIIGTPPEQAMDQMPPVDDTTATKTAAETAA